MFLTDEMPDTGLRPICSWERNAFKIHCDVTERQRQAKQKVTFNSSSIILIITNDESLSVGDSDRTNGSKFDVIQAHPL